MQNIAAYSFEAVVEEADLLRTQRIDQLIDSWLADKGAEFPRARDGDFHSRTGGGIGQFSRHSVTSSVGKSQQIELIETSATGAMFTTKVQVAYPKRKVIIYVSLSATPNASLVSPVRLYPRCPRIVRDLIETFPDWKFAGQDVPIGKPFAALDERSVMQLCDAIRSPGRTLPLIVVSTDRDEQIWHDLHVKVAEHLIGLADVAYVDEESSWLMTDELGPSDSCYLGAVRLYWPARRRDGTHEGITWVAARLAAFDERNGGKNRFLDILRREVMLTAAQTMLEPSVFREIHTAASLERLPPSNGNERDPELNSIIEENHRLVTELDEKKREITQLNWKLKFISSQSTDYTEIDNEASDSANDKHTPPEAGAIRYYKKIGSGGGVDTLVVSKQCNHKESNWKPAFKGDKAEKGLLRLEGSNNWKSLWHCSACTGGGRWKVQW